MDALLVLQDPVSTLVSILQTTPWIRQTSLNKIDRFENNTWSLISTDDIQKLTKIEAQIWLSLLNLLLEPQAKRKYQYSQKNKNTVLLLKNFITPELVQQLPVLVDLQRYLEELVMLDAPLLLPKQPFITPVSTFIKSIFYL